MYCIRIFFLAIIIIVFSCIHCRTEKMAAAVNKEVHSIRISSNFDAGSVDTLRKSKLNFPKGISLRMLSHQGYRMNISYSRIRGKKCA